MVSFTSLLTSLTLATTILAAPSSSLIERQSPSSSGTNNGWFYSYTASSPSTPSAIYTNLSGGVFKLVWSNAAGTLSGGKGFNPGNRDKYIPPAPLSSI